VTRRRLLGLAVALAAATAGCLPPKLALMASVPALDVSAPADAALVVFVRESSPCDGGEAFRIVDENVRFFGDSAPASKFTVRLPPGHHAFFAWQPSGDLPPDQFPFVNQVGAVAVDLAAGQTYYVTVAIANDRFGLRKSCSNYQWLALRLVDPGDADLKRALPDAQAWVPDTVAGQRVVDAERDEAIRHIELGKRKLRRP
jgi:hypothetical protein